MIDLAPDLVVTFREGYFPHPWINYAGRLYGPPLNFYLYRLRSGIHEGQDSCHGVFFAYGRPFRSVEVKDIGVVDVAPCILYCLGLPLSARMDGKVPSHIFNEEYAFKGQPPPVKDYKLLMKLRRVKGRLRRKERSPPGVDDPP